MKVPLEWYCFILSSFLVKSPRFCGDWRWSFGVAPQMMAVKSESDEEVGDLDERTRDGYDF